MNTICIYAKLLLSCLNITDECCLSYCMRDSYRGQFVR